jgi:hypothetical protein
MECAVSMQPTMRPRGLTDELLAFLAVPTRSGVAFAAGLDDFRDVMLSDLFVWGESTHLHGDVHR